MNIPPAITPWTQEARDRGWLASKQNPGGGKPKLDGPLPPRTHVHEYVAKTTNGRPALLQCAICLDPKMPE